MRTLQFFSAMAVISLAAGLSCQKAKLVPAPVSVTVVHALATTAPIVPKLGGDTAGRYYKGPKAGSTMLKVNANSSRFFSTVAGVNPFLVVPYPDTVFKIFNGNLTLESGGIYSFFISGDTAHADTMLVKDNIPYYGYDSTAGIRFINLSIGGKALTINLVTDSTHTEFPALGYRQISDFKQYSAKADVGGSYQFEIRDQASGTVLKTYFWSFPIYKNNTIVIAGSTDPAATLPLKIFSVNNF